MLKRVVVLVFVLVATSISQQPDYYHDLHLPHDPPLYPVYHTAPVTQFSCAGRTIGYYADVQSGCQAFHFCWHQRVISTKLCTNGTLFNEQFQYLGHVVTEDLKDDKDIERERRALAVRCNMLARRFSRCTVEVCDHFYNVRCGSPYEDL